MRLFPLRLIPLTDWLWMLILKLMTHFRSALVWAAFCYELCFSLFTLAATKLRVFQIKAVNQKYTLLLMMMKWSFGQSNSQYTRRFQHQYLEENSDTIRLAQPNYFTFYFHNFIVFLLISLTIPFPILFFDGTLGYDSIQSQLIPIIDSIT